MSRPQKILHLGNVPFAPRKSFIWEICLLPPEKFLFRKYACWPKILLFSSSALARRARVQAGAYCYTTFKFVTEEFSVYMVYIVCI